MQLYFTQYYHFTCQSDFIDKNIKWTQNIKICTKYQIITANFFTRKSKQASLLKVIF